VLELGTANFTKNVLSKSVGADDLFCIFQVNYQIWRHNHCFPKNKHINTLFP